MSCAGQGRLLAELQAFVAAAGEATYQALPVLAERAAAFQADTHALVYDVLMRKVGRTTWPLSPSSLRKPGRQGGHCRKPSAPVSAAPTLKEGEVVHQFEACRPGMHAAHASVSASPTQFPSCDCQLARQVRVALGGLAALPVWAAQEGENAAGGALPSFSAYPQQHVTVAGARATAAPLPGCTRPCRAWQHLLHAGTCQSTPSVWRIGSLLQLHEL